MSTGPLAISKRGSKEKEQRRNDEEEEKKYEKL
jgi:hypothetical protein